MVVDGGLLVVNSGLLVVDGDLLVVDGGCFWVLSEFWFTAIPHRTIKNSGQRRKILRLYSHYSWCQNNQSICQRTIYQLSTAILLEEPGILPPVFVILSVSFSRTFRVLLCTFHVHWLYVSGISAADGSYWWHSPSWFFRGCNFIWLTARVGGNPVTNMFGFFLKRKPGFAKGTRSVTSRYTRSNVTKIYRIEPELFGVVL